MAAPQPHSAAWAKSQILVQPKAGLSDQHFKRLLAKHQASSQGKLEKLRTHIISVPEHAEQAIVRALSHNPNIEFAELDLLIQPTQMSANDTYFANAWHLNKINAPTAWESSQGAGVIVAILDSGVNGNHTDLSNKMVSGWNIVSQNTNTADINGHGTRVAGTVAASSNNAVGVTSVAWHTSIMPIRVTNQSNGYTYWSDVAKGITWAADHGADIANVSYKVSLSLTIANAAQYMHNKGGLVVVSAGNDGSNLNCSDNANMITVSATDTADNKTSWSDYGNCVDVAAPGSGIWTTNKDGGYGAANGTSFSSPIVAGALALLKSANPNLTNDELENILESSADKSKNGGSFNAYYGHGRVDIAAALTLANETPVVDQEAPTVNITSPLENSTQKELFTVDVAATDNLEVSAVKLYADGILVGTDYTAPFSFVFDSTTADNGNVAFTADAFDAAQNQATSSTHWLKISNVTEPIGTPDTTAPIASISNPINGSTMSGTIAIGASATDNVAVTQVKLYIDGQLKTQIDGSSLTYSWNTRKVASGTHTIMTRAFDAAGNQTQTSVQVTIMSTKKGRGKK